MPILELSQGQRRIVAAAVTMVSLVIMISLIFWLARQVLDFFVYFSGVFLPVAVAGILATLMKPFYDAILDRLKSRTVTVIIVIVALIVPLGVILYYFGIMLLGQMSSLLTELPAWIEKIQMEIQEKLPALKDFIARYDVNVRLDAWLDGRSGWLAKSAAALGQGVVSTGSALFATFAGAVGWVVVPIYFAFLIQAPSLRPGQLENYLPFLRPETRGHVIYLATEFVNILVAFFRGQLIIALCQGLLFAFGFSIAGLPNGMILGILLGLLNIIPYLGNIVGLAVVLPLAWFHPDGGMSLLLSVMVVFVIVQCVEGYVLTPRIMGKTTGLHPMAIIFAILFWGTAFSGLLGMILAIPLTAFLVVFWRLLKERYIKEWL